MAVVAAAVLAVAAFPAGARAALPADFFGVSAIDPQQDDYRRMGKGGVGTFRILLSWPAIQPSKKAGYDWSVADEKVGLAASNGMQPFPLVYGSAAFAAGHTESPPLSSGAARKGWQDFVTAAVRRYGPRGDFWEQNPTIPYRPVGAWKIWNEQNAEHFWRPKASPRKYAKLLRLSSTAIKRVDSNADVVLGGMFGFPNGDGSIYSRPYLKELYKVGSVRKHFDAVALHPYGGTLELMRYQIARVRRIMNRNGDRKAPIWITEIGWATEGPLKWPLVTTEKGQAKRLKKAFAMLVRNRHRWGIKRVIWFAWRDFEDKVCRWCGGAGLISEGGKAKPAWHAFRRFTRRPR